MDALQENMIEFHKQLQKGMITNAYRGLIEYITSLKNYLKNKYPAYIVSASIYQGYLDMTYFSFSPQSFKDQNLKIAIVFNYEAFQFEAWLAGSNRRFRDQYWKLIKESGWDQYRIVTPGAGVDAILEHILVANPDFSDLTSLTYRIDEQTLIFIKNIEQHFSEHQS
jgi:hypothetical protein